MINSIVLPLTFCYSTMILAYQDISRYLPVEVQGTVLDAQSRKPVQGLHVFTAKGEEEGFTDAKGQFHFTSWQQLPLQVTVQQPDGKSKQVKVAATPIRLTILFP